MRMDLSMKMLERLQNMLPNIIAAAVIMLVGHFVNKFTLKMMSKGLDMKHVDNTVHKFLMSVVRVTILVLFSVMALSALNVPMSSILAAIGTAGITIGLALKDSLSNIAGGFIIMFAKPFKCGDYVVINKEEGTVDMINILYTRLLTIDNRAVFIPNSVASKSTVVNLTDEPMRRLELKFQISYSDDHNKAIEVIKDVLAADERIFDEPDAPMVVISEHADSAIVLLMRAWINTDVYWDVRFDLLKKVKEAFDANSITIPYGQLDVHIDQTP